MIIVTGQFELPADGVDAAKAAASDMMRETAKEDGCIHYRFYQDVEVATTFRVYEEWESEARLKAHFDTPHMAVFRAALGEIGLVSRKVKMIEPGKVTDL